MGDQEKAWNRDEIITKIMELDTCLRSDVLEIDIKPLHSNGQNSTARLLDLSKALSGLTKTFQSKTTFSFDIESYPTVTGIGNHSLSA